MNWPSVSVVIAALNRRQYVGRAVRSVFCQDYPGRVQVVVADGGSTDGTADVLRDLATHDRRLTWWSRPDGGIVDALQHAVAASAGDVLAIQDSDNWYLRDAFVNAIEPLAADAALSISTGCDVYVQPDGRSFSCSPLDSHVATPRSLLMRRVIPVHCAFFRRRVWDETGGYQPFASVRKDKGGDVGNVGVDIRFWYRALHRFGGQFVPWHVAAYQLHDGMMSANSTAWVANMRATVEACEADPEYADRFRLTDADKAQLYPRWELQQAKLQGDVGRVRRVTEELLAPGRATGETLVFLRRHGFIPKPPRDANAPRHPNHRVPELNWYESPAAASAAA